MDLIAHDRTLRNLEQKKAWKCGFVFPSETLNIYKIDQDAQCVGGGEGWTNSFLLWLSVWLGGAQADSCCLQGSQWAHWRALLSLWLLDQVPMLQVSERKMLVPMFKGEEFQDGSHRELEQKQGPCVVMQVACPEANSVNLASTQSLSFLRPFPKWFSWLSGRGEVPATMFLEPLLLPSIERIL